MVCVHEPPNIPRTNFSEKWKKLFFAFLVYFPWYLMLMYNFRKKYEFHRRSPGRNLDNISHIFDCFFIVNYQATGVMHRKRVMCTLCSPRLKIGHIWQKMLFTNFAHFSQNNEMMSIMMLCIMFAIFAKKCILFFRGGVTGGNLYNYIKL